MNPGNAHQLTEILNSVADGITVQNAAGKLVFVNKAAAKMLGYDTPAAAMEAGGRKIVEAFEFFDELGQPIPVAKLPGRRALKGEVEPAMVIGFTSTGQPEMRWSSVKAMPVLGRDNQVEFAVNVIQDITQLKQTELQLREANERITKLLEKTLELS